MKGSLKKNSNNMSWMAKHVREEHEGSYTEREPVSDWIVTVDGSHKKPLNRQVKESINIKKVRGGVQLRVLNSKVTVSKEIFNSKDEFFSHTNEWDGVV